jgi:hypothetical protein
VEKSIDKYKTGTFAEALKLGTFSQNSNQIVGMYFLSTKKFWMESVKTWLHDCDKKTPLQQTDADKTMLGMYQRCLDQSFLLFAQGISNQHRLKFWGYVANLNDLVHDVLRKLRDWQSRSKERIGVGRCDRMRGYNMLKGLFEKIGSAEGAKKGSVR